MKKSRLVCIIAALLFWAASAVFSFAAADSGRVKVTSDRVVYGTGNKMITLLGNVRIEFKDAVLTGETGTIDNVNRVAHINGNVRLVQDSTVITGRSMVIKYVSHIAEMHGNVTVVSKSRETGGKVSYLYCSSLVYDWLRKTGKTYGRVSAMSDNRRVTASQANYDGNAKIIVLTGDVKLEQGPSDWLTCSRAIVNMETGTIDAAGGVTGNFAVEENRDGQKDRTTQEIRNTDKLTLPALIFEWKNSVN